MKQSSRTAIQAELDMKHQEECEDAAELAQLEASYTEFERTGHQNEDDTLFSRWDVEHEAAKVARSNTIAGKDENGEPFKTTTDYFYAIRTLGWLTREERAVYERVRDDYRDQELLVAFDAVEQFH